MFKNIILGIWIACNLVACSDGGGSGGSSPTQNNTPWTNFSVDTATSLPTCSGDIVGRMYYVEDTTSFKVCKSTGWQTISIGNNIVSIKSISGSATDFCTQYTGEFCYIRSGQIVTMSDGSIIMTSTFGFQFFVTGDQDVDEVSDSFVIPSTYSGITKGMYPYVARGAGYKVVYLTFDKSTGVIRYYLDSNGDGNITGADELLYTPILNTIFP